jgi:hypothetical protein
MERVPGRRFKKNLELLKEYTFLCDEELEVRVTFMGITYSLCCRCHKNHQYFSRHWFLVYVDWDFLAY